MEVDLSPERQAQLNDYAHRHGQDPATALDDVLAEALEWERQDYVEAVEGIRKGYADFLAGRVRPVAESFEQLRVKQWPSALNKPLRPSTI
jgi:predicted transcriptional regulator